MTGETIRLDKWLWFSRFCKSRSLAARLCEEGLVEIDGRVASKPARQIAIGSVVSVPRGRLRHIVIVEALGTRRGPAAEAATLYHETTPPAPLRDIDPSWIPLLGASQEDTTSIDP